MLICKGLYLPYIFLTNSSKAIEFNRYHLSDFNEFYSLLFKSYLSFILIPIV